MDLPFARRRSRCSFKVIRHRRLKGIMKTAKQFLFRPVAIPALSSVLVRMISVCLAAGFFFLTARAVPNKPRMSDLVNDLLRDELTGGSKASKQGFEKALRDYDLAKEADTVMKPLTTGPAYRQFQRQKDLSSQKYDALGRYEKLRLMIDFAQTREEIKPEVKAWIRVFYGAPIFGWDEIFQAYQVLRKYRPGDLIGKMMVLAKGNQLNATASDGKRWDEWLEVVEETLPLAKTMDDKESCLLFAAGGGFKLQKLENRADSIQRLWELIRTLPAGLNAADPRLLRFNAIKAWAALAARDYVAGAEFARHSTLRVLEPMFLAWAGKLEAGARTLQTLRSNSTLSEKERAVFESIEPLVLISIRQFEEARAVLRTLRSKPIPSIESSRYLDSLEEVLSDWEAGVKARQMPDP